MYNLLSFPSCEPVWFPPRSHSIMSAGRFLLCGYAYVLRATPRPRDLGRESVFDRRDTCWRHTGTWRGGSRRRGILGMITAAHLGKVFPWHGTRLCVPTQLDALQYLTPRDANARQSSRYNVSWYKPAPNALVPQTMLAKTPPTHFHAIPWPPRTSHWTTQHNSKIAADGGCVTELSGLSSH